MIIAVIASLSPLNANAADRYFFNQSIAHLASEKAQHHYYIYTDAPDAINVKGGNISSFLVKDIGNIHRLSGFWTMARLKKKLKKQGVDLVLCFGTGLFVHSRKPSCLLVKPGDIGLKPSRRLSKILDQSDSILTVSELSKASICNKYNISKEKVFALHAAPTESAAPFEDDVVVKEKYSEGKEFFIYTGLFDDQNALINLMKAFSIFKKRQKTNWRLLLVNRSEEKPVLFLESLKKYKYRDDVLIIDEKEENIKDILAAAYAFVYPVTGEDYGLYILEAMGAGLPVIVPETELFKEITADAAIYYNNTVNDLAEKMMMLYKDETSRRQQAEKSKAKALSFNWQRTAAEIWQGIEAAG